jgi:hypothetical protein
VAEVKVAKTPSLRLRLRPFSGVKRRNFYPCFIRFLSTCDLPFIPGPLDGFHNVLARSFSLSLAAQKAFEKRGLRSRVAWP